MNGQARESHPRSHLLSLRIWREPLGCGNSEIRGQARLISSGDTCTFRDWAAFVDFVESAVAPTDDSENSAPLHADAEVASNAILE